MTKEERVALVIAKRDEGIPIFLRYISIESSWETDASIEASDFSAQRSQICQLAYLFHKSVVA